MSVFVKVFSDKMKLIFLYFRQEMWYYNFEVILWILKKYSK